MPQRKRVRPTVGDIVAIPLSGRRSFAFARVLRDASVEVFNLVSADAREVPDLEAARRLFCAGVFGTSLRDGSWPVVGRLPFTKADAEWPPPQRIDDILDPANHKIYFRGEIRTATAKEIVGLAPAEVHKPQHLVEKIESEFARIRAAGKHDAKANRTAGRIPRTSPPPAPPPRKAAGRRR